MPDGSASAHLYRPKLATVLAEGYNLASFRRDVLAGLTVAGAFLVDEIDESGFVLSSNLSGSKWRAF